MPPRGSIHRSGRGVADVADAGVLSVRLTTEAMGIKTVKLPARSPNVRGALGEISGGRVPLEAGDLELEMAVGRHRVCCGSTRWAHREPVAGLDRVRDGFPCRLADILWFFSPACRDRGALIR